MLCHLPLRDLLSFSSEIRGVGALFNVRCHPTLVRGYYFGIRENSSVLQRLSIPEAGFCLCPLLYAPCPEQGLVE